MQLEELTEEKTTSEDLGRASDHLLSQNSRLDDLCPAITVLNNCKLPLVNQR